jgi:CspA family cold shock protein
MASIAPLMAAAMATAGPSCPRGSQPGTVQFFHDSKGYGFITAATPKCPTDSVFVHFSAIAGDGWQTLRAGQQVCFKLIEGPKGYQASNVKTMPSAEKPPCK